MLVSKKIKVILLSIIVTSSAFSQTIKQRNYFTHYGVGTRGSVLKSGFVSIADDYSSVQWNPGGISFLSGVVVGGIHSDFSLNRNLDMASVIIPGFQGCKLGVSWKRIKIDQIPARTDNTIDPDYYFSANMESFGFSVSKNFFSWLGLGLNLKYFQQSLHVTTANGFGWDVGLLVRPLFALSMGIVLYDLNSYIKWDTGHKDYYEKVGRFGISYWLTRTTRITAGFKNWEQVSLGTDSKLMKSLFLRTGWCKNRLALGLGLAANINLINLNLNYAVANDMVSGSLNHQIDFNIIFRGKKKEFIKINVDFLNIRSGPGKKYRVVGITRRGHVYEILKEKFGWLKINMYNNHSGWIQGFYTRRISS